MVGFGDVESEGKKAQMEGICITDEENFRLPEKSFRRPETVIK